jgi:hypothetical protein
LNEERTEWIRREGGVVAPEGSRERTLFENRLESREPLATFALTNSLAAFLAPWLIVALGALAASFAPHPARVRTLLTLGLAALFVVGCLLLTKSRASFVAAGIGAMLVALYCRARGRSLPWQIPAAAGGLLVVVVLAAVFAGGLDLAVLRQAPQSVLYRLEYWQATRHHRSLLCGREFGMLHAGFPKAQDGRRSAQLLVKITGDTPTLFRFLAALVCNLLSSCRPAFRRHLPGKPGRWCRRHSSERGGWVLFPIALW